MTVYVTPLKPIGPGRRTKVSYLSATDSRELAIAAARLGLHPGQRQTGPDGAYFVIDESAYWEARGALAAVHPPTTTTTDATAQTTREVAPDLFSTPEEDAR
jgi:hypothetical protein